MMSDNDLIAALRRLKVQTGSLACLGCGREHTAGSTAALFCGKLSPLWKRSWRRTNPAA